MKYIGFFIFFYFWSVSVHARCIPDYVLYGPDTPVDLNQESILKNVRNDLIESDLLGSIPSFSFSGTGHQTLSYLSSGNLLFDITYVNGKKNGMAFFYYANGNILARIPYYNDQINGTFELFYNNGTLKMSVTYENGLKTGTGKMFYNDGTLQLTETYANGLVNGIQKKFYQDGNPLAFISYTNGLLDNESQFFYNNGTLLAKPVFQKGSLVSGVCYGPNGNISHLNDIEIYKIKNSMLPIECQVQSGLPYSEDIF